MNHETPQQMDIHKYYRENAVPTNATSQIHQTKRQENNPSIQSKKVHMAIIEIFSFS